MAARLKPARIEHVVDGHRLRAQLTAVALSHDSEDAKRKRALQLLHGALFRGRIIAKERLEDGENGWAVARLLAKVADEVISALYDFTTVHVIRSRNPTQGERFSVVAVGGYGRGELAPSSDIDLLFLRAYKQTPWAESVTEYMLYMLWDMGLKVGHASRTVNECIRLAKEDHTIETALLEARLIIGDESLAQELETRFRNDVVTQDHAQFVAAKLKERDERHLRGGASRYMVEPNIKEGKGGLRDLHTLFWLARHRYGYVKPQEYVQHGVFTVEEWGRFRRALEFLWTVRDHMHFITGRAEERLSFDLQPEVAKRMGYGARANQESVERFMKHYFLTAKEVGALTRSLCAKLEADQAKRAPRGLQRFLPQSKSTPSQIAPGFHADSGRLDVDSPDVLDDPVNLIRLFEIADQHDLDIQPSALGEAARRLRRITPAVRRDPQARAAFLHVAASDHHPAAALRLMNEAGVLGRFLPEFGRIVAQMQFNMYHHFTVDEHTLNAVEYISQIEKGRRNEDHPLSTEIFSKIINRRALYLAMLLHDTGKGAGDQQIEGEKSARAACERLGLPEGEVELVGWLVRHHLLMSDVAQRRDIGDPRTVAQFALEVGSLERLRLLLVLTVADIRAVGPGVWNSWKGQLLRDLYRLTEAAFHGGRSDEEGVRERLALLAREAKQRLLVEIGRPDDGVLDDWLDTLEDGYWLSHDAEALLWHAREVLSARRGKQMPHVAARPRMSQGVTELMVYAHDRPGLFASIASAISASGADIADARVHTTTDGVAFDVFSIQTTERKPFGLDDDDVLAGLIGRVKRAVVQDHPTPAAKAPSRRTAAFAIEPWVRADNDVTPQATVIEASGRDRPGLLAELARVFAEAKTSIVSAHIESHGERVSDVFYVQETAGGQLVDPRRIAAIRVNLEEVLRAAEPEAPADPAKQPLAVARASTAR
ncbi:MAG: [protein-PII] uridylyltransferase [Pseudomonadota bacterium]